MVGASEFGAVPIHSKSNASYDFGAGGPAFELEFRVARPSNFEGRFFWCVPLGVASRTPPPPLKSVKDHKFMILTQSGSTAVVLQ